MLGNIGILMFFIMIAACVTVLYLKIYSATKKLSIDVSFLDLYVELHKRMFPIGSRKSSYSDDDIVVIKNLEKSIARVVFCFGLVCLPLMMVFIIF